MIVQPRRTKVLLRRQGAAGGGTGFVQEQKVRRGQDRRVTVDHRVHEGVLLVEPIVHHLDVVLAQIFAHGPAQGAWQEIANQAFGVFLGLIFPMAMVDRLVRLRQDRIKKSVPDALDLLVVCVEAGTSLDAAILRVAKELRLAHPDLSHELAVVNRLTNAGMPREEALRGLWKRTGVLDIRALVSSLIQSEKWGTSIATVLRVAAETLRRKRRQDAEKRAKMAPLKMTFPLLFFILPALFAVILGPAVVQIIQEFSKI